MTRAKFASINGRPTKIPRKGSKYGAKRSRCIQGHSHPSKGEAGRCNELHACQACGLIRDLKVNPSVTVVKGFKYKADFSYTELIHGRHIVEDFKGAETQRFRDIKRMWPHHGKGTLLVSRQYPSGQFYTEKGIEGKEP